MNSQPTTENIAIMRHLFNHQRLSAEAVALQVASSIRTDERWRRKFELEEHDDIPAGDGRINRVTAYKITDEKQLDQAIEVLNQDPFMAASDIPDLLDINVTGKPMRKSIKERRGILNFKAAEKPELRDADELARIRFANQYRNFTVPIQWNRTFFLDEKTFSTEKDSRCRIWRPRNTRYQHQYVKAVRHSGRISIACWGYVSALGPGTPVEVGRRMNANRYRELLDTVLLPDIDAVFPDNRPVYILEDNSAVHTARIVRDWYTQHPRLQRLVWAPRSPDLNPIENVWAEMVRDWKPAVRTEVELRDRIFNRWEVLRGRPGYFQTLAASMPRRIQQVIDSEAGKGINYCKFSIQTTFYLQHK